MAEKGVVRLSDPENYKVVKARIKQILTTGEVRITIHANKRMRERNFDLLDVTHILQYGRITDHSKPKELWRYEIAGQTLDGKKGKCIVEINGSLIIITIVNK